MRFNHLFATILEQKIAAIDFHPLSRTTSSHSMIGATSQPANPKHTTSKSAGPAVSDAALPKLAEPKRKPTKSKLTSSKPAASQSLPSQSTASKPWPITSKSAGPAVSDAALPKMAEPKHKPTSSKPAASESAPLELAASRRPSSGKREFPFAALGCFLAFFCLFLPFAV
jgi:hypothetical protein